MDNYYDILGIEPNADQDAIRKAYRKMSLKHHPDKNLNDQEAAGERFIKISAAYQTLSDPANKAAYDNALKRHQSRQRASATGGPHAAAEEEKHSYGGRRSPRRPSSFERAREENEWEEPSVEMDQAKKLFEALNQRLQEWAEEQERCRDLGKELADAVKDKDYDEINRLVEDGAFLDEHSRTGKSPLHYFILRGEKKNIDVILNKGANVDNQTKRGDTPLHCCVIADDFDTARKLVGRGAALHLQNYDNKDTALHAALDKGALPIADLLVNNPTEGGALFWKKTSHDFQDQNGDTPLHLVLRKLTQLRNRTHQTDESFTQQQHYHNFATILLQRGANVTLKNEQGMTAFDYRSYGVPPTISRLLHKNHNKQTESSCAIM